VAIRPAASFAGRKRSGIEPASAHKAWIASVVRSAISSINRDPGATST
jgi:hypothetical protein